jgi:hypothetical protein|eukprot:COSAG06_NODE_1119_length_10634_cov_3.222117_11_plen_68_part_00
MASLPLPTVRHTRLIFWTPSNLRAHNISAWVSEAWGVLVVKPVYVYAERAAFHVRVCVHVREPSDGP